MTVLYWGLLAFLLLGGLFPLRTSPRRSAYPLRNSTALAAFLILGPEALVLVLPSALLASLLPFRLIHLDSDASVGRVLVRHVEDHRGALRSIGFDTLFLAASLLLTHGYYAVLLGGRYPVPLDRTKDLLVYLTVAFTASSLLALFSELYFRWTDPRETTRVRAGREWGLLPEDAPLYGLLLTIGSPLQLLTHLFYLTYGTVPFLFGLASFAVFAFLHSLLHKRRRRFAMLLQDLEASERLAALGELTGRIVHRTRHQLGLIGITVHMVRDALDHSDPAPKERIRKELDRLEGVAQTLREMLTSDLAEKETDRSKLSDIPHTLLSLVRGEVERLSEKAKRRSVVVSVEGPEDAHLVREPREIQRLGEGIFNVLENAISAARARVIVRLERSGSEYWLEILDDGSGMEPSFLARACEPFTTTKKDGTGMGLAIALSAARLWDGDLTLRNQSGGGLKALFRLRLVPASRRETAAREARRDA